MSHVSRYLEPALVEYLNHMHLSARSVVQGSTIGSHKSPTRGASVEFRQHRFYVPGDEPRHLDWRVLGRTDRPYVKEYDEETNLRCLIMLDCSGSMAYAGRHETKFDYACRILAALAYLMLGQTENVGLAMCAADIQQWLAPRGGPMQLSRVIDALERAQPDGPSGIASALHDVAERLERRALVIVLSDFYLPAEKIRAGLAHLRHKRHEVIAIQLADRDELDFPFRTWTRFRGLENESPRLAEPAVARRLYLDAYQRHIQQLNEMSLSLDVQLQLLVTDKPILETMKQLVGGETGG